MWVCVFVCTLMFTLLRYILLWNEYHVLRRSPLQRKSRYGTTVVHASLSRTGKFSPCSFRMPTSVFYNELCRRTKIYAFALKRSHCLSSRLPKIKYDPRVISDTINIIMWDIIYVYFIRTLVPFTIHCSVRVWRDAINGKYFIDVNQCDAVCQ